MELRQELRRMREAFPAEVSQHMELLQTKQYTWQLEQQLVLYLSKVLGSNLLLASVPYCYMFSVQTSVCI